MRMKADEVDAFERVHSSLDELEDFMSMKLAGVKVVKQVTLVKG
jgi:hypothetical protein